MTRQGERGLDYGMRLIATSAPVYWQGPAMESLIVPRRDQRRTLRLTLLSDRDLLLLRLRLALVYEL